MLDRWIAGLLVLLVAWEVVVPTAAIKASSSSHTSHHSGNQDSAAATKQWRIHDYLSSGDLSIPQEMIDEYYGPSKVHTYYNGDHNIMWTPVHVMQFKQLTDVPAKPISQDIPVFQLLDMNSIEYFPGVVPRKGSLEVWTPIAARLRPRIRDKTNCT